MTTDDVDAARRLRGLRQFGTGINGWGTNYKITKVQAAVGVVQLRRLEEMIARRVVLARQRTELLRGIPEVTLPYEPPECEHTFYLYTLLVPPEWAGTKRDRVMSILEEEHGVGCVIANRPVYADVPFIRKHTAGQELPLSKEIGERLFCVALRPLMTEAENEYIAAAVWDAVERVRKE